LKSPNVLIHKTRDKKLVAKVADFGLAKAIRTMKTTDDDDDDDGAEGDTKVEAKTPEMTLMRGSLLWMAPEVYVKRGDRKRGISRRRYDNSVDVYSFGIMLWETLELTAPWSHERRFQHGPVRANIMLAVENEERPPMTPSKLAAAPDGFDAMIRASWAHDPSSRPSFSELLHELQDMQLAWAQKRFAATLRPRGPASSHTSSCSHVLRADGSTPRPKRSKSVSSTGIEVELVCMDPSIEGAARQTEAEERSPSSSRAISSERSPSGIDARAQVLLEMHSGTEPSPSTSPFSRRPSHRLVQKASASIRKVWAARDRGRSNSSK